MSATPDNWREHGVRVIRHDEIGQGAAADLAARLVATLTHVPTGIDTLAAHTLELAPGAIQPAHHHDRCESVICVISGQATVRWGNSLEFCCAAGPGDLVVVPPGVPHQEENASCTEVLHCVLLADAS